MKKKAFCIIITLCLLALLVSCSADKASEKETKIVDVLIDYSSYGGIYSPPVRQILQEPRAWQDEKMSVEAKRVRYEHEKGVYTYADEVRDGKYYYEFECDADLTKLYIQVPTVEIPCASEEFTVSAAAGETVYLDGNPWFSIDDVEVTSGSIIITFFIEDSHPTVVPLVDGVTPEGSVSTCKQTEDGYSYKIEIPFIGEKEIPPEDVLLSIAQVETFEALDADYETSSDVTLIPVSR